MNTITIHNHTYEIPTEVLNHLEGLVDAVKEWNMKRETYNVRRTKASKQQMEKAYQVMMSFVFKTSLF